jgi:hypothetical protein
MRLFRGTERAFFIGPTPREEMGMPFISLAATCLQAIRLNRLGRKMTALVVFGAAALGAAASADAAPSVYIVAEKTTLNKGESSFFDVYVNSDGLGAFSLDMHIGYTNNNLTVDSASILGSRFWQSKPLYSLSQVDGKTANLMRLNDTSYANSVIGDDAAFRVNFTAGQSLGTTQIYFDYIDDEHLGSYVELLTRNSNGTNTNWNNDGGNLAVLGADIQVTPEPATLVMLALGALAVVRRRRS